MKTCDHFKDLILTDYIDRQLDKKSMGEVESHLLTCASCCAFLREVKEGAVLPFQKAVPQTVPAYLWDAIKQNIEHEEHASPLAGIVHQLQKLIAFPKMVPVFASLVVMILVGSATLNTIQIQRVQAKDQGEYLVSLLSSTGSGASDSADLGTPIEHYFL